jgi:ABC-type cobalamin/Fe3+-siderophores transport system ATPase subunit
MHRLAVHNFGPIRDAEVDVGRFLIFIGPQASGKSTLSKLIYYFLHVRDEVMRFAFETASGSEPLGPDNSGAKPSSLTRDLKKRLRNRFVEFFGPTPQPQDVRITYRYTDECQLEVALDRAEHRYVDTHFSRSAWLRILDIIRKARQRLQRKGETSTLPTAIGKLASDQMTSSTLEFVRAQCNELFGYSKELFFIPAGRSMLSTLSDQLQYIHPHLLDYPMRQFVDTVNRSRVFFDRSLDDIVRAKLALSSSRPRLDKVRKAQHYIRSILHGDYVYDREGGKVVVNPKVFTKISFASSGQQEVVWILLSLFLLVLEQSRALVVVEEPEAHLYPDAQKTVVEFIAFVMNSIDCDFIVTTHSPYLLGFANNLIYAKNLGTSIGARKVRGIVPEELWIDADAIEGYFVDDGTVCPMLDKEVPALKWELLDHASDEINNSLSQMFDLEADSHAKKTR